MTMPNPALVNALFAVFFAVLAIFFLAALF